MISSEAYFVPYQEPHIVGAFPSPRPQQFDDTLFEDCAWHVILGDPGSGKTTATKKLVLDYVNQAQQQEFGRFSGVPIYVPLRSFARERNLRGQFYPILEFIYDYAAAFLNTPCSPGFFEYFLDAGECLVCFDGLDEVAATGQRQEIRDMVESFVNRYPRNRYLVTSRIVGYEQGALSERRFAHCTVQPLSDPDIQQYVTYWYLAREKSSAHAESRARELSDTIMQSERLRDLARNPLLLTIIALMHRVEAELPHERVKLYEKCTEALLFTFENVKRLDISDASKECMRYRRELLESVAFWMQSERTAENDREAIVEEAELRQQVVQRLRNDPTFSLQKFEAMQQAEVFVRFVKERTGLLVERGDGQYAFVHLTFQEYFAACHVWRNYGDDPEELLAHISPWVLDPSWREVILLLLGKLSESPRAPSRVVEWFLAKEDEDEVILRRRLRIATDCLVDKIRMKISLIDEIILEWMGIIDKPLCSRQRQLALQAISEMHALPYCSQRLATLALDSTRSLELRTDIIWLALDHQTNQLPTGPGWVIDSLRMMAMDHTAPASIRATALSMLLDIVNGRDLGTRLCLQMLAGADDECTVCVDGLRLHSTSVFRSVERMDPDLRDAESPIPSAALLTIETTLSTWDQSVVHQIAMKNPTLAILLGALGWEIAWCWLHQFLCDSTLPNSELGQLFKRGFHLAHLCATAPEPYRTEIIEKLAETIEHPAASVELVESIHWLFYLGCPVDRLWSYVLRFNSLADEDNWNIHVMSQFFSSLMRTNASRGYVQTSDVGAGELDNELHIKAWASALLAQNHLTLQVSFAAALLEDRSNASQQLAEEYIFRIAEQDDSARRYEVLLTQTPFQEHLRVGLGGYWKSRLFELLSTRAPTDSVCYVACAVIDSRLLNQAETHDALTPLLIQTDSPWSRLNAATRLFGAQLMTQQDCLQVYMEYLHDKDISMYLRQDLARSVIRLGGDKQEALKVLREVLTTDHEEANAKDAAFTALQELVTLKPTMQDDVKPSYLI